MIVTLNIENQDGFCLSIWCQVSKIKAYLPAQLIDPLSTCHIQGYGRQDLLLLIKAKALESVSKTFFNVKRPHTFGCVNEEAKTHGHQQSPVRVFRRRGVRFADCTAIWLPLQMQSIYSIFTIKPQLVVSLQNLHLHAKTQGELIKSIIIKIIIKLQYFVVYNAVCLKGDKDQILSPAYRTLL